MAGGGAQNVCYILRTIPVCIIIGNKKYSITTCRWEIAVKSFGVAMHSAGVIWIRFRGAHSRYSGIDALCIVRWCIGPNEVKHSRNTGAGYISALASTGTSCVLGTNCTEAWNSTDCCQRGTAIIQSMNLVVLKNSCQYDTVQNLWALHTVKSGQIKNSLMSPRGN